MEPLYLAGMLAGLRDAIQIVEQCKLEKENTFQDVGWNAACDAIMRQIESVLPKEEEPKASR